MEEKETKLGNCSGDQLKENNKKTENGDAKLCRNEFKKIVFQEFLGRIL